MVYAYTRSLGLRKTYIFYYVQLSPMSSKNVYYYRLKCALARAHLCQIAKVEFKRQDQFFLKYPVRSSKLEITRKCKYILLYISRWSIHRPLNAVHARHADHFTARARTRFVGRFEPARPLLLPDVDGNASCRLGTPIRTIFDEELDFPAFGQHVRP